MYKTNYYSNTNAHSEDPFLYSWLSPPLMSLAQTVCSLQSTFFRLSPTDQNVFDTPLLYYILLMLVSFHLYTVCLKTTWCSSPILNHHCCDIFISKCMLLKPPHIRCEGCLTHDIPPWPYVWRLPPSTLQMNFKTQEHFIHDQKQGCVPDSFTLKCFLLMWSETFF